MTMGIKGFKLKFYFLFISLCIGETKSSANLKFINVDKYTMLAIRDKLIDYYERFAAEHIKLGHTVTPNNLKSYASYATKIVRTDKDGKDYYDQFKGKKVGRFINDLWEMGTFKKYYQKQI